MYIHTHIHTHTHMYTNTYETQQFDVLNRKNF